jgi:hypothetical protein
MGASYSAEVFFGAFVKRGTPLGKKLDEHIDKAGGTPAKTGTRGVMIGMVGSQWSGEIWLTVEAKGSGQSFSQGDDVKAPRMLTEDPAWRPAILAFFASMKITEAPPVGWHFAASVS